jgi:S-formylglutathione hydrolase FrmB
MALQTLSEHACFGGVQGFHQHDSGTIGLPMRLGVYRPPQALNGPVPALIDLDDDRSRWAAHDATEPVKSGARCPPLRVDQGLADRFMPEQLHPHLFGAACAADGQPLTLRRRGGCDHGCCFIASVVEDALRHHGASLSA